MSSLLTFWLPICNIASGVNFDISFEIHEMPYNSTSVKRFCKSFHEVNKCLDSPLDGLVLCFYRAKDLT